MGLGSENIPAAGPPDGEERNVRAIVVTSLGLALAFPFAAGAQTALRGQDIAAAPGLPQDGSRRPGSAGPAFPEPAASPQAPLAAGGFSPPGQKPPRPEKAIGPDLVAYIFEPIGGMVGPITEGLHAFDAAIAPINEALQPLTGPYGAALEVAPDEAPGPAETGPLPAKRGPRK